MKENNNLNNLDTDVTRNILINPKKEWENHESIICDSIFVNDIKKIKMIN